MKLTYYPSWRTSAILITSAELQVNLAEFYPLQWLLSCFTLKSRDSVQKKQLIFFMWLINSWNTICWFVIHDRKRVHGWVPVSCLTILRGHFIRQGGSSLFLDTLTLRASFQFAAGFPVFPHLSSLGKYSCLPAPAYSVCFVVLLPAVLSCIFLAKYLGHGLKRKILERQFLEMKNVSRVGKYRETATFMLAFVSIMLVLMLAVLHTSLSSATVALVNRAQMQNCLQMQKDHVIFIAFISKQCSQVKIICSWNMIHIPSLEIKGCASHLSPLSTPVAQRNPSSLNHLQKDGMALGRVTPLLWVSSRHNQWQAVVTETIKAVACSLCIFICTYKYIFLTSLCFSGIEDWSCELTLCTTLNVSICLDLLPVQGDSVP